MRLDKLIQALLPHGEQFYDMFAETAGYIEEAARLIMKLPDAEPGDRDDVIRRIRDLEHLGDDVTHKISVQLNATFVTPFDPEDIHQLASALDDILDNIDGSARRFALYKVGKCPPELLQLMEILHASVLELVRGISLLKGFKKPKELMEIIKRVNEYEDEADVTFARAVGKLFDTVQNHSEIVNLIKMKEIFVTIETATDRCEDVAYVIEAIVIKHA